MAPKHSTLYKILSLPFQPILSQDDLRKAYHAKALELHPDKNSHPSATAKFQELNQAYEGYLSHPQNTTVEDVQDGEDDEPRKSDAVKFPKYMRTSREKAQRSKDEKENQKESDAKNFEIEKAERREIRELAELKRNILKWESSDISNSNSNSNSNPDAEKETAIQLLVSDYETRSKALEKKLKNDGLNKRVRKVRDKMEEIEELRTEIPVERRDPGMRPLEIDFRDKIAKGGGSKSKKTKKAKKVHVEDFSKYDDAENDTSKEGAHNFTKEFLKTVAQGEEAYTRNGLVRITQDPCIPQNNNLQIAHYCDEEALQVRQAEELGFKERERTRKRKEKGWRKLYKDGKLTALVGDWDAVRGRGYRVRRCGKTGGFS
ncbi:DnaJ-domain-containing protein [Acephala macrosclerotiorum]|nr:DnaJ-domain-containing protein [Acephala macrosclerotiorum]